MKRRKSNVGYRETSRVFRKVVRPSVRAKPSSYKFTDHTNRHSFTPRTIIGPLQGTFQRSAPGRLQRRRSLQAMRRVLSVSDYKRIHDCKKEWSRLLSWRSDQKKSGGGKARTARELRNNKSNFKKRDC